MCVCVTFKSIVVYVEGLLYSDNASCTTDHMYTINMYCICASLCRGAFDAYFLAQHLSHLSLGATPRIRASPEFLDLDGWPNQT